MSPPPGSSRNFARMVALLILCLLCIPTSVLFANAREMFQQSAFSSYQPDIENGRYLAAAAGCAACHASGNRLDLLAGGLKMETAIGTFYVPNITASPVGIGGWSNADYLNAVMNGTAPDGRNYYPVFPYGAYAGMKPEDLLDIRGFLATLPQSDAADLPHEVSFPYNLDATIALWKRGNFDTLPYVPGDGSVAERGRYLIENVGACNECHTPRTLDWGLDKQRALVGEKGPTGSFAPDISKERLNQLSDPTPFVEGLFKKSKKLSGSPIVDPLKQRLVAGWRVLSSEDRSAILAYITGAEVELAKPELEAKALCLAGSQRDSVSRSLAPDDAEIDRFFGQYCRGCHGPGERNEGSFPTGDLSAIASNPTFVTPGDRQRSVVYQSVATGRMPFGSKPSAAEIESLGAWIDQLATPASAPRSDTARARRGRPIIQYSEFLAPALSDLSAVAEKDRPFIRYFSYREQYNGLFPCETAEQFAQRLPLLRAGFDKLLNSTSSKETLVVPIFVPGTRELLVRIDLRDLGWSIEQWDRLASKFPYAIEPSSEPALAELTRQATTQVPILRTDWFTANAPRPEIYYDLLALPATVGELEARLGVNTAQNILAERVMRAGIDQGASGVSEHNRMIERHALPSQGYYWKSYDFAASSGRKDLKRFPHGPEQVGYLPDGLQPFRHDGGEMIFSLPNGLQGYYLSNADGGRLDVAPTKIVSFRNRPIGKGVEVVNSRSCFDCHADGIIPKGDHLRQYIQTSPILSKDQQAVLLRIYVEQTALKLQFAADRERFVQALDSIGAAEPAPEGELKSRSGPAGAEIVTWNADLYEDALDLDTLSAEFDRTPDDLEKALARVEDPAALRLGIDWMTQLKAGSLIPRSEVELNFPAFLKSTTGLSPLVRPAKTADALSGPKNPSRNNPRPLRQCGSARVPTFLPTSNPTGRGTTNLLCQSQWRART